MHRQAYLSCTLLLSALALTTTLNAQTSSPRAATQSRNQIFAGYGFFSNSFNGHSTGQSFSPLNGWNAAVATSVTSRLSIKVDAAGYYGTSLGSPQHPLFFLVGPKYDWSLGRKTVFVDGLIGYGHINKDFWGGDTAPSTNTLSFAGDAGIDLPIARRAAFRIQGGYQYADFNIPDNQIHNQPRNFARISTGLVWHF